MMEIAYNNRIEKVEISRIGMAPFISLKGACEFSNHPHNVDFSNLTIKVLAVIQYKIYGQYQEPSCTIIQ
ncbi:hypothetical protein [Methanolobus bombayensis]|uniref:hypothetical protein n=1 Tax=Methanolobus bombayensis TaxID=38023 RepID=UPI001AE9A781|nr:hypothetical protein [Methanolobus bombayensis]MBP1910019.1 hypothetical protein [Methanolobus bombayensis]